MKHFYIAFDGEKKEIGIAKILGSQASVGSTPSLVDLPILLFCLVVVLVMMCYVICKERIQSEKIRQREAIRLKNCLNNDDETSGFIFPVVTRSDLKLKLELPPKSQTSRSYLID